MDDFGVPDKLVAHQWVPGAGTASIKLERGQKGAYGWEIRIEVPAGIGSTIEAAAEHAIEVVSAVNADLLARFGPSEP